MKNWLTGLLTALLLTGLSLPVMAAEDIDARIHRAQERINSGEIAPKERHRLEGELKQIRERSRELQRRMDRLEQDIDQARRQRRELIPGVPVPQIPTPR